MLTPGDFSALDIDNDGFLSEADLEGETPAPIGCPITKAWSKDAFGDFLLLGLSLLVLLGWRGRNS